MTRAPIEPTGSGKAGHPVMPEAKGSAAARQGRRAFVKVADLAVWMTMVRQMAEVLPEDSFKVLPEDWFKKPVDVAQGTALFYTVSETLAGTATTNVGTSGTTMSSEEQITEDVETDIRLRLERMDREIDELEARADRLIATL